MASYFFIAFLIIGITLNGAFQSVVIPILDTHYQSIYFILVSSSAQFCLCFAIIYLCKVRNNIRRPKNLWTLIIAGIFNGLMSVSLIYSSDPTRTPVVLQSILSGIVILPSVVWTKLILNKKVSYTGKYTIPSIISLILAVTISTIPLYTDWQWSSGIWILVFITGTIFRSLFNIFQEKYFIDTKDTSLNNKITNVFYIRLIHFLVTVSFFWLEFLIGYTNNPLHDFVASMHTFIKNPIQMGLLEGFVLSYIILYILGAYLNTISANYNMITAVAATPANAVFFTIFSKLNPGIQYPLYIIIPSLLLAMASIMLWVKGENNDSKEQQLSLQSDNQKSDSTCCNEADSHFITLLIDKILCGHCCKEYEYQTL